MARAPLPGACKTRLARVLGDQRAASLYQAMLLDTLAAYATLPAARLVVLAAPENDGVQHLSLLVPRPWEVLAQRGRDLGERLAIAQAELRPGVVLLVSSDSPAPPVSALREALQSWSTSSDVLLGPCADGGYYLIGLPSPETRVFQEIDWSTDVVLAQTRARCEQHGIGVRLLPPAVDVDEVSDLEYLRAELAASPGRAPRTSQLLGQS
jgi:hypothetical protein